MRRILFCCALLSAVTLAYSMPVSADCGSDCSYSCDALKGQNYEDCMVSCLQDCVQYDPPYVPDVPEPTPVDPNE